MCYVSYPNNPINVQAVLPLNKRDSVPKPVPLDPLLLQLSRTHESLKDLMKINILIP